MNTQIRIFHNMNRAGLGGYSVDLYETEDAAHELRRIGPVDNGVVSYRGVFARDDEALRAALDYLPLCLIVRVDSPHGSEYRAVPVGWQRGRRLPEFASFTVLAGRSEAGTFIHS